MLFRFGSFNFDPNAFSGFQPGAAPPPRKPGKPKKARKPIRSPFARVLINLLVTLVVGGVYFYVVLPPLNPQAPEFYSFLALLLILYCISALITSGFQAQTGKDYFAFVRRSCKIPFFLILAILAVCLVGGILSWQVLRAASYQRLLPVEDGDFASEVAEVSYDQIPMLDEASAMRLGDRKLGELADMVSQFEVADNYTQINYQGRPVRVTPLVYGDIIKWFNNRSAGLPAYIVIDMVTQNVDVVRLDEGMKYTTAEHFSRNLYRHLRFHYPTTMFAEPVFEINEEGVPYWICPKIVKTIGLFGGTDIRGAVLVNAITGESSYYEEVPAWVDRLYDADLIVQQYDYYGMYQNGWLNSIFGQRDVTVTTEGYNYIVIGDDVYMYTGVTSVGGDQSNVGFLLVNQRTKETKYYPCAGAKEYSAMSSAQGQVQHLNYTATFPLLLNIGGEPTYFMSLKDAAGLVKMYAMVNVQQYQIVATGATVLECEEAYRQMLATNHLIDDSQLPAAGTQEVRGAIADIRAAVLEGNSYYYLSLRADPEQYYAVNAAEYPLAVILDAGDRVVITVPAQEEAEILTGCGVKRS